MMHFLWLELNEILQTHLKKNLWSSCSVFSQTIYENYENEDKSLENASANEHEVFWTHFVESNIWAFIKICKNLVSDLFE